MAYIVGLRLESRGLTIGALPIVTSVAAVASRVLKAVERDLLVPVSVYMVAITTMGIYAVATRDWRAIVGAVLFMVSDSLIAWDRFVHQVRYARLAIMSTYHLAQAALVLSLLRR